MISRRDFVTRAGSALAAGCLPVAAFATSEFAGAGSVDFDSGLSKAKFRALLREQFSVATRSDGVMVLQLVELRDGRATQGRRSTEGFTLFFRGVASPTLGAGIYTLEHGSAGKVTLRLEPVRTTAESATYRAHFCLLV